MSDYKLEDRRPIKEIFRKMAYQVTDICVALGIKANWISYASVFFAALTGLLLFLSPRAAWLLLLAPWFGMLRLYCNMLDGMVAVKAGEASSTGEVINELPDRVSDALVYVGIAHTPWANTLLAYWAMFGMLFVAYVGVLGKAVGAKRQYGGIMPKPVRMYFIVLFCTLQFFIARSPDNPQVIWGLSVIDIGLILVLVGLLETAASRTFHIFWNLTRRVG